ncbi:MAG: NAD(P)/FAD-dependent oxidoreductase [Chloroflexi bacterium]|nr:NAD(P)/FAD-dependent oxidoreductase [Chloroflexota bacterium]
MMYDLIIVGGGPSGLTAAVYALNKRLETLLISEDLGGKTAYDFQVKGYEGHEVIRGREIVDRFKHQLEYLNFAYQPDRVAKVTAQGNEFVVTTEGGRSHQTRSVIVATGAAPRRLDVPGEASLVGKGLSYSALSHAQLFVERKAAIVGTGARALTAAAELAPIAKHVHLVMPETNGIDTPLGKKLRANPKVTVYEKTALKQVRGDEFVEGIVVEGPAGSKEIPVEGLFIEMGLVPASKMVQEMGITDDDGRIRVDNKSVTARAGIFASGDVTDVFIEQVLIAIGEGAKAALSAYEYLIRQ